MGNAKCEAMKMKTRKRVIESSIQHPASSSLFTKIISYLSSHSTLHSIRNRHKTHDMSRFYSFTFVLVYWIASGTAFSPATISRTKSGTRREIPTARFNKSQQLQQGKSEEDEVIALDKATKAMTAFTNKYLQNTGTTLCADKSVPAVVIKGLAAHKIKLGAPLCPCRFYEDKEAEAKDGYWNCPCVPMRERHECHCMLFLTEDNPFAGSEQVISYEEVVKLSKDMS